MHNKAMPAAQARLRFILFMRMGFLFGKMGSNIFPAMCCGLDFAHAEKLAAAVHLI